MGDYAKKQFRAWIRRVLALAVVTATVLLVAGVLNPRSVEEAERSFQEYAKRSLSPRLSSLGAWLRSQFELIWKIPLLVLFFPMLIGNFQRSPGFSGFWDAAKHAFQFYRPKLNVCRPTYESYYIFTIRKPADDGWCNCLESQTFGKGDKGKKEKDRRLLRANSQLSSFARIAFVIELKHGGHRFSRRQPGG